MAERPRRGLPQKPLATHISPSTRSLPPNPNTKPNTITPRVRALAARAPPVPAKVFSSKQEDQELQENDEQQDTNYVVEEFDPYYNENPRQTEVERPRINSSRKKVTEEEIVSVNRPPYRKGGPTSRLPPKIVPTQSFPPSDYRRARESENTQLENELDERNMLHANGYASERVSEYVSKPNPSEQELLEGSKSLLLPYQDSIGYRIKQAKSVAVPVNLLTVVADYNKQVREYTPTAPPPVKTETGIADYLKRNTGYSRQTSTEVKPAVQSYTQSHKPEERTSLERGQSPKQDLSSLPAQKQTKPIIPQRVPAPLPNPSPVGLLTQAPARLSTPVQPQSSCTGIPAQSNVSATPSTVPTEDSSASANSFDQSDKTDLVRNDLDKRDAQEKNFFEFSLRKVIVLSFHFQDYTEANRKNAVESKWTVEELSLQFEVDQKPITGQSLDSAVYARIRDLFGVSSKQIAQSLKSGRLSGGISSGRSGSYFYITNDKRFILKSLNPAELKLLRTEFLAKYVQHIESNPDTLLPRFFGCYRLSTPSGTLHFFIMNNLFVSVNRLDVIYDLKGSIVNRKAKEEEKQVGKTFILKDNDFLENRRVITMERELRKKFLDQLQRDANLLRDLQIMDYSLLIGIHGITQKEFKLLQAGRTDVLKTSSTSYATDKTPYVSIFQNEFGGIRAKTLDGDERLDVYFIGIIDVLQKYDIFKASEGFLKSLRNDRSKLSAVDEITYAQRFHDFIASQVLVQEGEKNALGTPPPIARRVSPVRMLSRAPPPTLRAGATRGPRVRTNRTAPLPSFPENGLYENDLANALDQDNYPVDANVVDDYGNQTSGETMYTDHENADAEDENDFTHPSFILDELHGMPQMYSDNAYAS